MTLSIYCFFLSFHFVDMMAAIVNPVREEVAVVCRASAGAVLSNSTVSPASTLATRVGVGKAFAATGKHVV